MAIRVAGASATSFLFIEFAMLGTFTESAVHWLYLLRPTLVGLGASLLIGMVSVGLVRHAGFAVGLSLFATMLLFGEAVGWIGLLGLVAWALAFRFGVAPAPQASHVVGAAGLLFFAGLLVATATHGIDARDFQLPAPRERVSTGRNAYVLLLDGYPRHDVLLSQFGIDNAPFEDELEAIGFQVGRSATVDDPDTLLALLRMVSDGGAYVEEVRGETWEARREARRRAAVAPSLAILRDRGYSLIRISTGHGRLELGGWDHVVDTGQITNLEAAVLRRTAFAHLTADWLLTQHRDRVKASLEALVSQTASADLHLVLGHVIAPHPPFAFDGAEPPECWPMSCHFYETSGAALRLSAMEYSMFMRKQISWINSLVLPTVRELVRRDPAASIVVLSDHGSRDGFGSDDLELRTLLAVRHAPLLRGIDNLFVQITEPG